MQINDFQNFYKSYKKGSFASIVYASDKGNGYTKITRSVVRFVEYGHINGVQVKGKTNPNFQAIIPNVLSYNTNTKNYLVQCATTEVPSHTTYYHNNVEITKDEFNANVKQRPSNGPLVVFSVKLDNIQAIG